MIEIVKRLVCDWCGAVGPDVRTVAGAREMGQHAGWARLSWGRDEFHICPACVGGQTARATPPRGAWVLPVLGRLLGRVTVPTMDTGRWRSVHGGRGQA